MAYKKQMLEKYLNLYKSKKEPQELPYKTNDFSSIDDIICEKNTLEIQNSLLRYENIKLIKENKLLKTKLEDKIEEKKQEINYWETIHWEMIEELNFSEWLYNKKDLVNPSRKYSKKTNKRKSSEGDIIYNTHTHTQESKKVKVTESLTLPNSTHYKKVIEKEKEKDVIVIYDSDETETDDEIYDKKVCIIEFDRKNDDYDLINDISFTSSSTKI